VVLVTVSGPGGREDVVVASDVAVFQLLPALTALVGGEGVRAAGWGASAAARWHLLHGGRMLAPTRTLLDAGVVDGHELRLKAEG
jgi:hypothetical protein